MIELRWKVPKAPDYGKWEPNSVLIQDDVYAVLQYRVTVSDFYYPHIDENGIKTLTRINPEWQDVEISDE